MIFASKPPIGTTEPGWAMTSNTPADSAGNSKVALSDSNSQRTSSKETTSPDFLFQTETVTSEIDSPTAGTLTSKTLVGPAADAGAAAGAGAATAAGAASATVTDAVAPPASIVQMTAPIGKTSPSFATMCKIPSASAGNSNVALSDSSSHNTSSNFTWSPSFLFQVATVTSVIDSPTAGTFISIAIIFDYSNALFINAACSSPCTFKNPVAGEADFLRATNLLKRDQPNSRITYDQ